MQSSVVGECRKSGYGEFLTVHADPVTCLYAPVVCVHAVDHDLVSRLCRSSVHDAVQVDIVAVYVHPYARVTGPVAIYVLICLLVEVLEHFDRNRPEIRIIKIIVPYCIFIVLCRPAVGLVIQFLQSLPVVPGPERFTVFLFGYVSVCVPYIVRSDIDLIAGLYVFYKVLIRFLLKHKMPVFAQLFGLDPFSRDEHGVVGYIHSRNESYHQRQEDEYDRVFFPLTPQFPQDSYPKRIACFLFHKYCLRSYQSSSAADIL